MCMRLASFNLGQTLREREKSLVILLALAKKGLGTRLVYSVGTVCVVAF